ncbi:type II secretion system F family protein [Nocardioides sp. AX2bis]|uniref:type II secretion system F family protein n=1 Tax=Nocardioides sp. AX2bis TaxID=2653157 RepID=UPI0012F1677A|nr:type II secretion system F family protein [Nocardioides sp. AX2bis]VXB72999.1 Type II/IV secretion system protein TadC, associated with Flp pilus assembly [Nocardioides sp. AX2bis]
MLLLLLGCLLVVGALVLVAAAVGGPRPLVGVDRSVAYLEALNAAPEEIRGDADPPFAERVLTPMRGRALALGRRLSGADSATRIRRKLDLAGNPREWSVDAVVSGKVMGAIVLSVVALAVALVVGTSWPVTLLVVAGGTIAGFFLPELFLYQRAYDRADRMQRELPDAIDLLRISVESGLGFDAAVQQVARNLEGPLSEEFARVLKEMQLGQGRAAALRGLGERTDVEDIKGFVSAMVQADSFGIPVAQVLEVQSTEMRVKRRQRAEEKAQQVPVKITVPLIFFVLPTLFVAVMGPAALSMMDNL